MSPSRAIGQAGRVAEQLERDLALARGVVDLGADAGVEMALVAGSVARGLADAASDIDVYLYCDRLDRSAADRVDRLAALAQFTIVTMKSDGLGRIRAFGRGPGVSGMSERGAVSTQWASFASNAPTSPGRFHYICGA